jgi:hypothetical protein
MSNALNKYAAVFLPTIPGREALAKKVIRSFLAQEVGKIFVFLNGHTDMQRLSFRRHKNIVYIPKKKGTGPISRFQHITSSAYGDFKYIFTVDDDILYPLDYVSSTIEQLNEHGDSYAISYHVSSWKTGAPFYQERSTTRIETETKDSIIMPFGGSGASAYSRKLFSKMESSEIPKEIFEYNDDIWLSSFVQNQGYLFLRPATRKNWMSIQRPHPSKNLFESEKSSGFKRRNNKLKIAIDKYNLKLNRVRSKELVKQAKPKNKYDIFIYIKTYNRAAEVINLLRDLSMPTNLSIGVKVYDDSSHGYEGVQSFISKRNWEYHRFRVNNGKLKAWLVSNEILSDAKSRNSKYFMILPDDIRLCDDFLNRSITVWNRIQDDKKAALVLARDSSRDQGSGPGPCWTGISPKLVNKFVWETGWVDEMFISEKKYFEILEYSCNEVSPKRFRTKNISSGVGRQASLRIVNSGHKLYCVDRSLVRFVGCESKMNKEERILNPMVALGFIDVKKAPAKKAPAKKAPAKKAPAMRRGRSKIRIAPKTRKVKEK